MSYASAEIKREPFSPTCKIVYCDVEEEKEAIFQATCEFVDRDQEEEK